jgi:hypothetical protein
MGFWLVVLEIGMPAAVSGPGWLPLLPIGMFAFGVGMIALGLWFSRNDPKWLSGVIQGALGTRPPDSAPVQQGAGSTPLVLRLSALFFALAGAVNVASAFFPMHDAVKGVFPWGTHPELPVVYGLCLLALAAGVYRRQMWAWLLGLLFFGLTCVLSVVEAYGFDQEAPLPVRVFSGVAMPAVALVWTRWWYAQRRHFVREADPFLSE